MSTPKTGFSTTSYAAHERTYDTEINQNLAQTWTKENTIDSWRHARMYQCVDPLLIEFPGARWLTVGDGRYGTDAHYLEQHHADAVATDIADGMLQRAKAAGYIKNFQKENAEQLSFEDESFDFVLCKEAYHHFPRPMIALYEMIRVAKRGVVLIEPDESRRPMGLAARPLRRRRLAMTGATLLVVGAAGAAISTRGFGLTAADLPTPGPSGAAGESATRPTTRPTASPSATPSPRSSASSRASSPTPPAATATPQGTPHVYVAQKGDSLSRIAARFGVTIEALMAANGLANPNVVNIGQVLVIPD